MSSFICQDYSFTLPSPQFPCCYLLTTGISSKCPVQAVSVLAMTASKSIAQYPVLPNTGKYWAIPQYQYRSNPTFHVQK